MTHTLWIRYDKRGSRVFEIRRPPSEPLDEAEIAQWCLLAMPRHREPRVREAAPKTQPLVVTVVNG